MEQLLVLKDLAVIFALSLVVILVHLRVTAGLGRCDRSGRTLFMGD